ncbi:hypothetical protein [Streptomyces anulatus]|uniref:hypothetical protein n=1 Tax=Streptomyces anulatus TaxID=1892 RepID=UPI001C258DC7|nr:hypothetical protein [Streptomyces anulatus]
MTKSASGGHEETYRGSHIRVVAVPERELDSGARVLAHLALRVNGQAITTRARSVDAAVRRGRRAVDRTLLDARLLPVLRPLAAAGPGTAELVPADQVSEGDTVWVYGWGLWRRGRVTHVARVNVTVSYVTASNDKVHHKAAPARDLRREVSAAAPSAVPAREEAVDSCRRCGKRIGLYKGLRWGGDDDFMCPDGESQHAPRGLWRQRADRRSRGQIAAAQGSFMRSANGGTPRRVPARAALGEIKAALDDGVLVEDRPGDAAVIPFRDRRGRIELRPATAQEIAEPAVADHEVYGPGSEVTVRPVTWDRPSREHVVGEEFAATVVHGVNGARYKVRRHGGDGIFTLSELRPAGATRRPVEALRAGSHAVWNTGARAGDTTSRRWPTSPYVYACRDCRTRGTRGDLETRPCTPQAETALSLERAEGLLSEVFARWESRVTTVRGTDTGVFSRGVAVEMAAAELRAGASHAWQDDGLTLRRDGFTTVLEPYRSPEERAAEAQERAAEDLRWKKILADTEEVAFEDLEVGDVLVRGYGDGRRGQVVRPAEDFTDRFGRPMRRLWCRAVDCEGQEGWVEFGPGGRTLRQIPADRQDRPSLPQYGQPAHCGHCGKPVARSREDLVPGSGSTLGVWVDTSGGEQCSARDGLAGRPHAPTPDGALGPGDVLARFRRAMGRLAHGDCDDRLAGLLAHAVVLFPVLDGRADLAEVPEQFRSVMHAAASVTHPPALAALARHASRLWEGGAETEEGTRDAFVGCLPEHAGHSAVGAALAHARGAGVPLAVIGRDWRWSYGEHGAQGLFVVPTGERSVECTWFVDGRSEEGPQRPAQVRRLRPARNGALAEVRSGLADAGWSVLTTASRRTHTLRLLSVLATMPDANGPQR